MLCKTGPHGDSVCGKQRSVLLKRLESWTLKTHVHCVCNSHSTTMCVYPITPRNMLASRKRPTTVGDPRKPSLTLAALRAPTLAYHLCPLKGFNQL